MLEMNVRNCLILIAAELFLGATMLAGYQAWVEPGAPRHRQHAAALTPVPATAATPVPSAEVVSLRDQGVRALTAERFAEALRIFQQASKADPANPDLAYLTGVALEGTNQVGAAIDAFRACRGGQYASQARDHIGLMIGRLQEEMSRAVEAEAAAQQQQVPASQ